MDKEKHTFSRDGFNFVWTDGWLKAYDSDGLLFQTIDAHFESDDDVWEFFNFMRNVAIPKTNEKIKKEKAAW